MPRNREVEGRNDLTGTRSSSPAPYGAVEPGLPDDSGGLDVQGRLRTRRR
jgi:hypothetical protein